MYKESKHLVVPLIDGSSEDEDAIDNLPLPHSKGSYRTTISLGAALAIAVLLVNMAVLVWAKLGFSMDPDGIVTVYEGMDQLITCVLTFEIFKTLFQVRVQRPKI
jgi:hypothetical protein